ncbi:NADH:ubiquinone oxidoreductase subunit NDUFA12 [Bauldia litoralis]|uniref:NADH:ubiquinone oxidoreductase subunit n=1 Tax=Bauldia litoralis TaxID=665467 RepID=A0A1G6AS70_9HYPH|nr:NADH:ubiquinone oxidoreductase subunit NDUFA12 [Bauldia litoralis]SDB11232.1 NADH:ubiquinone oxidoreductase subunit [Bauldia litoralis]
MKSFLLHFFTWWNGETIGTRFWTWRKGELVGEDEQGNQYYRERKGTRRWVIYNGLAEASRIPPGWHSWIHFRVDEPPAPYTPREWEKPHQPNMTGTALAYRPPGSILNRDPRTPARPDYEPWSPEG